MKITVNVDATPQELRTFFGLPEVETLQKEMMEEMRKKMLDGVPGFDASTLMKMLAPDNMQTLQSMQKGLWDAFLSTASSGSSKGDS